MKAVLLPLSLVGFAALTSCVNPSSSSTTNKFGYRGTVTGPNDGATVAQNATNPATPSTADGATAPTTPGSATNPTPINLDTSSQNNPSNVATNDPPKDDPAPPSNIASNSDSKPADNKDDSSAVSKIPYAIPVPGKEGLVYSPHNKNAGHADVRGMRPGVIVEDPYAPGKYFRVP